VLASEGRAGQAGAAVKISPSRQTLAREGDEVMFLCVMPFDAVWGEEKSLKIFSDTSSEFL
jgi:hypothetical protein